MFSQISWEKKQAGHEKTIPASFQNSYVYKPIAYRVEKSSWLDNNLDLKGLFLFENSGYSLISITLI